MLPVIVKTPFVFLLTLMIGIALAHDTSDMRISKTIHDKRSRKGDPLVITWGIVPDGTKMPATHVPPRSNLKSDFVASMDAAFGEGGDSEARKVSDYRNRPWFKVLAGALKKFESKTGLTYVYVPYDDGSDLKYVSSAGRKNERADLRIGGLALNTEKGVRAYSGKPGPSGFTPNIIFNTAHPHFGSAESIDFLLGHENMHNLGSDHILVNSNPLLTAVSFIGIGTGQGPQFDDLLGLHMRYGDVYEKGKGNNSLKNATDLGTLAVSQTLGIGLDAGSLRVKAGQTDFVSIDGSNDIDCFQFEVKEKISVTVKLTPRGPAYSFVEEDSKDRKEKTIDAAKLSDLYFALSKDGGRRVKVDKTKLGEVETVTHDLSPGKYYVSVRGKSDKPQFYSVEILAE